MILIKVPDDGRSGSEIHGKLKVALVNGECDKVTHPICFITVVKNESIHCIRLHHNFQLEPAEDAGQPETTVFQVGGTVERRNLDESKYLYFFQRLLKDYRPHLATPAMCVNQMEIKYRTRFTFFCKK